MSSECFLCVGVAALTKKPNAMTWPHTRQHILCPLRSPLPTRAAIHSGQIDIKVLLLAQLLDSPHVFAKDFRSWNILSGEVLVQDLG